MISTAICSSYKRSKFLAKT